MKKLQNLLIVGCGDVARRVLPLLQGRYRIFAALRDPSRFADWRGRGAIPVLADLDAAASLRRLHGLAGCLDVVLHFAPPPDHGAVDSRTRHLLTALMRGKSLAQRLIYIGTSGVYGDCAGDHVDETRRQRPQTARARRRADAEWQLRRFGRHRPARVSILRAPGIYAADRLPLARLEKGMPVLCAEDDVFTNHIHADDLARLVVAALRFGRANRCYNASDDSGASPGLDSGLKMGDYFDLVADRFDLPRPSRIGRSDAERQLSPVQLSFMRESRRLLNRRIKTELRASLRYPRVADGIEAAWLERKC